MKSNKEWLKWGRADPLYAVATWNQRHVNGPNPWTFDEFYQLGKSDWHDFHQLWLQFGLSRRHVLEIGCGAGRITKQLVGSFDNVSAFDVSAQQLSIAVKNVIETNVSFAVTNGLRYEIASESVSAVFSCHVFQHFYSRKDGICVFDEIFRVLEPGGSICVHLPIYNVPQGRVYTFARGILNAAYFLGKSKSDFSNILDKLHMRMTWYERESLLLALETIGFDSIEIRGRKLESNGAWHDILFARKPFQKLD